MKQILILVLILSYNSLALSCSCSSGTLSGSYQNTDKVFRGKVICTENVSLNQLINGSQEGQKFIKDFDESYPYSSKDYLYRRSEISIIDNYKVFDILDTIVVFTPATGGGCGFNFVSDNEYIIFIANSNFNLIGIESKLSKSNKITYEPFNFTTNCHATSSYFLEVDKSIGELKNAEVQNILTVALESLKSRNFITDKNIIDVNCSDSNLKKLELVIGNSFFTISSNSYKPKIDLSLEYFNKSIRVIFNSSDDKGINYKGVISLELESREWTFKGLKLNSKDK